MFCPCPDNGESVVFYPSSHRYDYDKIDLSCTSKSYFKPKLFKCKKCKLIFSEFAKNINENTYIKELKYVEDDIYIKQIDFKTKYFNLFFKKIKSHLNSNSDVLEIGSYYGVLGNIIKPHVRKYIGLELSIHASQYAKKNYELDIYNGTIQDYIKNNDLFDIIIMNDVIEHLDNPFESLNLLEKKLKPDGILIFTTYDMNSIYPRLMGRSYPWIMPYHLYYFSNFTLKNLCEKNNLEIFKIKNDTRVTSFGYLMHKFGLILPKLAFIFRLLLRIKFLERLTIKVNLFDLNIYFAKKKTP